MPEVSAEIRTEKGLHHRRIPTRESGDLPFSVALKVEAQQPTSPFLRLQENRPAGRILAQAIKVPWMVEVGTAKVAVIKAFRRGTMGPIQSGDVEPGLGKILLDKAHLLQTHAGTHRPIPGKHLLESPFHAVKPKQPFTKTVDNIGGVEIAETPKGGRSRGLLRNPGGLVIL